MALRYLAVVLFVSILLSSGAVQAGVIDDFQVGPITVTADSSEDNVLQSQTALDPAHVLEGQRWITVQGSMTSGSIETEVDISGDGSLIYRSNDPVFDSASQGRLLLTYLPGDRFTTFDLPALLDGDVIALDVLNADFGDGVSSIDAGLDLSTSSTGFYSLPFTLHASTTPYTLLFPLEDFTDAGADLSNVYHLTFDFEGLPPDATFTLGHVSSTVIPEPTSLATLTLFGSMLLTRRRRRHG